MAKSVPNSTPDVPESEAPQVTSQEVLDFLSTQPAATTTPTPQAEDVENIRAEYQWWVDSEVHGKVEVDEADRDCYLKAALHDTPFVFRLPLFDNRFVVDIRSLTAYEREVIARALTFESPESSWLGLNQIHDRQQGFAVCMSVQAVNGTALPNIQLKAGQRTVDEDARAVRTAYLEHYLNMNRARYQLLLNAVRIFAIKERICDIALARDHFWNTAGVG